MPPDHRLQRPGEGLQAQQVGKGELRLQQISVTLQHGAVVIKNARLQGRQRVDVLHIRRTAGDAGENALDGRRGQPDQRQHVRRDVGAISGNAVGRHRDFATTAQRRRQGGQCRLTKQHFHIRRPPEAAHPAHQADRQQ